MASDFHSVVSFNIGGHVFTTLRETLLKEGNSRLALIARGLLVTARDPASGAYVIDRDPKYFQIILNWLRDGWCLLPKTPEERRELLQEVRYYQLTSFEGWLRTQEILAETGAYQSQELLTMESPRLRVSAQPLSATYPYVLTAGYPGYPSPPSAGGGPAPASPRTAATGVMATAPRGVSSPWASPSVATASGTASGTPAPGMTSATASLLPPTHPAYLHIPYGYPPSAHPGTAAAYLHYQQPGLAQAPPPQPLSPQQHLYSSPPQQQHQQPQYQQQQQPASHLYPHPHQAGLALAGSPVRTSPPATHGGAAAVAAAAAVGTGALEAVTAWGPHGGGGGGVVGGADGAIASLREAFLAATNPPRPAQQVAPYSLPSTADESSSWTSKYLRGNEALRGLVNTLLELAFLAPHRVLHSGRSHVGITVACSHGQEAGPSGGREEQQRSKLMEIRVRGALGWTFDLTLRPSSDVALWDKYGGVAAAVQDNWFVLGAILKDQFGVLLEEDSAARPTCVPCRRTCLAITLNKIY